MLTLGGVIGVPKFRQWVQMGHKIPIFEVKWIFARSKNKIFILYLLSQIFTLKITLQLTPPFWKIGIFGLFVPGSFLETHITEALSLGPFLTSKIIRFFNLRKIWCNSSLFSLCSNAVFYAAVFVMSDTGVGYASRSDFFSVKIEKRHSLAQISIK